ncbi:hypothetical protein JTB14_030311 [Gonioctena quinquepunctata]|nr:hypothetical protein JTB14_030311 [Gonioctena quinquepunctata]
MVIIKHSAGRNCERFPDCASIVSDLQSLSAQKGWPDIYCNFLIGGDGNIYEGRGWGVQPQERENTVDIVFIGSFDIDEITPFMLHAAQVLIEDGIQKNFLSDDYIVVAHNQTKNTMSPGQNVFAAIKKWPHYDPNMYFNNMLK